MLLSICIIPLNPQINPWFGFIIRKLRMRNAKKFVQIRHLVSEKLGIYTQVLLTLELKISQYPYPQDIHKVMKGIRCQEGVSTYAGICTRESNKIMEGNTKCSNPIGHYSGFYMLKKKKSFLLVLY